jgi:hypothetical protein
MPNPNLFKEVTNFYRTKREAYKFKKPFEIVVETHIGEVSGDKTYGYCRVYNTAWRG